MRSHVEFASAAFPPYPGEEETINPGIFGKRLAEFLASSLAAHGFKADDPDADDWGWRIDLQNDAFPLWIGCANYEEHENGFLCFIEPSKPFVRRWFRKIDARPTVDRLAESLDAILRQSGKVDRVRWWTEDEIRP